MRDFKNELKQVYLQIKHYPIEFEKLEDYVKSLLKEQEKEFTDNLLKAREIFEDEKNTIRKQSKIIIEGLEKDKTILIQKLVRVQELKINNNKK